MAHTTPRPAVTAIAKGVPFISSVLLLGGATVFFVLPMRRILFGVYAWHIEQPSFTDGGLVLLSFLVLTAALFLSAGVRSWTIVVGWALAAVYLQSVSMLVPLLVAWLYFETLLQVGRCLGRRFRLNITHQVSVVGTLAALVLGVSAWTLLAVLASVVGFGTINHLRAVTLALALACVWAGVETPLIALLVSRVRALNRWEAGAVTFIGTLVLAQLAKSNFALDYDSSWYGFRPEKVLFGPHGIFDDLRLAHFVYYYPKQFELVTAPLADLGERGFLTAFNGLLFGIALMAIYEIAIHYRAGRFSALCLTALVGTIPAFANMASSMKSDNFANCFFFVGFLFAWRWARTLAAEDLSLAGAAFLACVAAKITMLAFVPFALLGIVLAALVGHQRDRLRVVFTAVRRILNPGVLAEAPTLVLILALSTFVGLLSRAFVLTGVPLPPYLTRLWSVLGFQYKYPWTGMSPPAFGTPAQGGLAHHTFKLLFDPSGYSHYVMVWPGNIAPFAVLALLVLGARDLLRRKDLACLAGVIPVALVGSTMALFAPAHADGASDGNYFAVPVVLTVIACAGVLLTHHDWRRVLLCIVAAGFLLVQLPIMFVSHWSWHPGTSPIIFSLKALHGDRGGADKDLRGAGLWPIETYLRGRPQKRRCVGFSRDGQHVDESVLRSLSCAYEDFEQMQSVFPGLFASEKAFTMYLAWARPSLVIAPRTVFENAAPTTPAVKVIRALRSRSDVSVVEGKSMVALDIDRASCVRDESCLEYPAKDQSGVRAPLTGPD